MNLYIRVKDGIPVDHPAFEDNLLNAFNEIPNNWEPFLRIDTPILDVYELLISDLPSYEKINGVWTDVWDVRPMTDAEKVAKQQATINAFNSREQAENWSAWTLDEETCTMVPPIPRPTSDQAKLDRHIFTFWCGADNNWKDTPPCPQDDKPYKFDFFAWQWIEVVSE